MPLDANKIAHIQSVTLATFAGRQQTVIFVILSANMYSYVPVQAILRPQTLIDPEIPGQTGTPPRLVYDTLMITALSVSYNGIQFVANTSIATASGVAAAAKYEILENLPVGIIPGGTHRVVRLRRFR